MPYKDNTTEFIPENEQTEFRDPSILNIQELLKIVMVMIKKIENLL